MIATRAGQRVDAPSSHGPARGGSLWRRQLDWLAFAALAILAAVAIAHFGRAWTFFYDEWGVILYRRSGAVAAFAAPLNGHLVAIPLAVYRILFATFGLSTYTPYRWVTIVAHVGVMALVYAYARRRVPGPLALVTVAPLLVLGYAWEVLFWMMNLGFVIPLMCFVALLLLGDHQIRRRGVAELLLVALALASSGLGVAVSAGVVADKILHRRWREVPFLLVPLIGYALWFFLYRPGAATPAALRHLPGADPRGDIGSLGFTLHNLDRIPHYVLRLAESAAGGLLGGGDHWFWLVVVVLTVLSGLIVRRRVSLRFGSIGVALAAFWLLTSMVRAQVGQPTSSRYIYPGAVLLILLALEAWDGIELAPRTARIAAALLACAALVAVGSSLRHMQTVGNNDVRLFAQTNGELARLSCEPKPVPPAYAPDPVLMPFVAAGPYRAAVHDLGSPVPARVLSRVCGVTH